MLRGKILILFFILFVIAILPKVSASVVINEVMPNPIGQEPANEWVELYSTNPIEIVNWNISDSTGNIYTFSVSIADFAILSCNNVSFFQANPAFNTTIPVVNLSCKGNGWLNNGDDGVLLYDNNNQVLDNFSYSLTEENKTYARISETNWTICSIPTPGTQNNCTSPNQPPVANFTYSPQNPIANQPITFDAGSSYDADGTIISYSWNFGDSTTATGITPQHAYTTTGNFPVNLTVTDSNNASASSTKTISVLQNQSQQNQTQNCMLEITHSPTETYFGSVIDINISVYRNETAKYAVYLWVQDNEGEMLTDKLSFHATPNKSANYTFNTSLAVYNECNVTNRTFAIMLEGMDEKVNRSVLLKENVSLCRPDFEYKITPPSKAKIGENFTTIIKIINNKNYDAKFDVWGYAYRGSKCYSCTTENREENLNRILVEAKSSSEVLLYNIVKDAEPGDYSLKVKILREGAETAREYTYSILLESANESQSAEPAKESGLESNLNAQNINKTNSTVITGKAIYNSKIELDKKSAEIIFISALAILVLYFVFRPKIIEMREHGV